MAAHFFFSLNRVIVIVQCCSNAANANKSRLKSSAERQSEYIFHAEVDDRDRASRIYSRMVQPRITIKGDAHVWIGIANEGIPADILHLRPNSYHSNYLKAKKYFINICQKKENSYDCRIPPAHCRGKCRLTKFIFSA